MARGLGRDLGLSWTELDSAVEAMLFADLTHGETAALTHAAWCTQVDVAAAAAKTRLPDDPALHAAVDRTVAYMRSSAYLEEQRDATQAGYDAYARHGGADDEAPGGDQPRLERLRAELARLDALVAGAKATEVKAQTSPCGVADTMIDAVLRANLTGAAWPIDPR